MKRHDDSGMHLGAVSTFIFSVSPHWHTQARFTLSYVCVSKFIGNWLRFSMNFNCWHAVLVVYWCIGIRSFDRVGSRQSAHTVRFQFQYIYVSIAIQYTIIYSSCIRQHFISFVTDLYRERIAVNIPLPSMNDELSCRYFRRYFIGVWDALSSFVVYSISRRIETHTRGETHHATCLHWFFVSVRAEDKYLMVKLVATWHHYFRNAATQKSHMTTWVYNLWRKHIVNK